MFKSIKVKNGISWVGSLDNDIKVFDIVMHTEYGTTYNAYIVEGKEKTALVESSKPKFFDEHTARITDAIGLGDKKIDYIIVNHTEPDHTGTIEKLINLYPDIIIVGTKIAMKFLEQVINRPFHQQIVTDGDTLDLGEKELQFIMAPFLHWPDTMFTYAVSDKTLFTCDFFGCHYCDEKLFNDAIEGDFYDAYKYYFDGILSPFKEHVLAALKKIESLDIDTICPGHGPIIRQDIQKYVDYYTTWSQNDKTDSVVICYVSAYGYTRKLAQKIADGIKEQNPHLDTTLYDLVEADKQTVLNKISKAKGLLIGSPTLVGDTLPPVWDILSSLNPIINKGLIAGAFGSYGWSGEAVPNIEGRFKQLRLKTPVAGFKVQFNPTDEQLESAVLFGKEFASALS